MKKIITLTIALTFFALSNVLAQSTSNQSIDATAEVSAAVAVTTGDDIDFTNVAPGINASIGFDGSGGIDANGMGGDASFGQFFIDGAPGGTISLELTTLPSVLTGVSGNALTANGGAPATMPATFGTAAYVWIEGAEEGGGAADLTSAHEIELDGSATQVEVRLGGLLQPASNQATGTYEASITLTATQTSI